MAIIFDPVNLRIILDSTTVSANEIYSRWIDWVVLSDNVKYLPAFSQVGGDSLGGGLYIPIYLFLLNGWKVRPMEANQLLNITGNLFVEGGGAPVVPTLGNYNVSVQYTVPVQAQAMATTGNDPASIATAVWEHSSAANMITKLVEVWGRLGLDPAKPMITGQTQITFGDIVLAMIESPTTVTVSRQ